MIRNKLKSLKLSLGFNSIYNLERRRRRGGPPLNTECDDSFSKYWHRVLCSNTDFCKTISKTRLAVFAWCWCFFYNVSEVFSLRCPAYYLLIDRNRSSQSNIKCLLSFLNQILIFSLILLKIKYTFRMKTIIILSIF